jgi:hypothetical protein
MLQVGIGNFLSWLLDTYHRVEIANLQYLLTHIL